MRHLTLVLFSLLTLASMGASAAVYKWVDEAGKTHYTDRPHEKSQKVRGLPGQPRDPKPESGEEDPEETEASAENKVREQRCELAQTKLKEYQQAGELYSQDEFGKKKMLSPEEQVKTIVNMQAQVDAFCTSEDDEGE